MNARPIIGLAAVTIAWMGLATPPAAAGEAVFATSAGTFTPSVTSLLESRFRTVVHQERDYSCGSAAVATLLSFHYDHPVSEDSAFTAMFVAGDQDTIQRYGFSLADMQRYLASLGFASVTATPNGASLMLANNATQIVQQVTHDQVMTMIGNAANGLTLTQHTDMNVTLPGFLTLNRQYNVQTQVASQVMASAVFGLGGR